MTKIKFKTTQSARQAAFLRGETLDVIIMLDVNPQKLTLEQREIIAPYLMVSNGDLWNYEILGFRECIECGTIEDVISALQKYDADQKEQAQKQAAELEAKRQKAEADAAARQARVEALKSWTLEHGTDYLRDLINMGFNWQKESEKFWFEMHTPPGWKDGQQMLHYANHYAVTNPSPEGIEVLKAAQKEYGAENVSLIRLKFYDGESTWHEDHVSLTLTSPLGTWFSVEKYAADYVPQKTA